LLQAIGGLYALVWLYGLNVREHALAGMNAGIFFRS
jgi:hypothetical protein